MSAALLHYSFHLLPLVTSLESMMSVSIIMKMTHNFTSLLNQTMLLLQTPSHPSFFLYKYRNSLRPSYIAKSLVQNLSLKTLQSSAAGLLDFPAKTERNIGYAAFLLP